LIGTAPDADNTVFPLNKPVLIVGSRREAAKLGATGTLPMAINGIFDQIGAMVIVIRVKEGEDEAETIANIIGGVDAQTGDYKGVQAFLSAESIVHSAPRILIAPGFTHQRPIIKPIP
jgi:phage tail sheath protein FI